MRTLASILLAFEVVTCFPVFASAAIIDLGDADEFAILAMPDGTDTPYVNLFASAAITGDVGVGQNGTFDMNNSGSDSRGVFGDVLLAPGVTQLIESHANITGALLINQDLSSAIADALAASTAADDLTATQTFGTITDNATWNSTAPDGVNIIDVTTIDLGNIERLTLHGSSTDFFIINVSGLFDLTASSQVVTSGGLLPGHVLFNFPTAGDDIHMSASALAEGTFLAPHRDAVWDGYLVNGAVIANDVRLGSSANLVYVPFGSDEVPPPPPAPVIPEPATGFLIALGLLAIRRFEKRHAFSRSAKP
jgi:choice-of-anchor A domain-containing protein